MTTGGGTPIYDGLEVSRSASDPNNSHKEGSRILSKLFKVVTLCVLALIGGVGLLFYQNQTAKDRRIEELQAELEGKKQVIARLGSDRRVADLIVVDQRPGANGRMRTEVLFQEYDHDDRPLAPRYFTIDNHIVHVSGLVIKFQQSYVEQGDDLRGRSILLFDRIYGDHEGRDHGQAIDPPGKVPLVYQSGNMDKRVVEFERGLWSKFWAMANDTPLARSVGVDVAFGQSVFTEFKPGKRYTIRVQNNGSTLLESADLPPEFKAVLARPPAGQAAASGQPERS